MRFALVIAPSDARSGDASSRREALAWLRGRLARFGFHVVIVGGVQDPWADIHKAMNRVSPGDTVLVHASGRLAGREALSFGDATPVDFAGITDALSQREPAHVSFVLELTHEEDENDPLLGVEILQSAVASLQAKSRGYPVLAAVRPLAMGVERVAFTRLALPEVSEHAGPPPTEAIVASMYEAASATEESRAVAQSFTFSRGGASIMPPPPTAVVRASAVYSNGRPPQVVERVEPHVEPDRLEMGAGTQLDPADPGAFDSRAYASEAPPRVADPGARHASFEDVSGAVRPVSSTELSIHSLIAEATEMRDWGRALELRRLRLHELQSPRQKSKELVAIARILHAEFRDAEGAIEALEMARALDPKRDGTLQALRRGYERLERWGSALEVTAALAELAADPADRAKLHVRCAHIALDRMGDPDRAVAWFDAALTADPTNRDALDALSLLRAPAVPLDLTGSPARVPDEPAPPEAFPPPAYAPATEADPAPLSSMTPYLQAPASTVPAPIPQLEPPPVIMPAPAPVPMVAGPLSTIPAPPSPSVAPPVFLPPPMGRPAGFKSPSSRAPEAPPDVAAHERLADRLLAEGIDEAALEELEAAVILEPLRPSLHEKVFGIHRRAGRNDAALLSGFALEALGAADVDVHMLVDQFRSVTPVKVRSSLDEAAWRELVAPGADAILTDLFAAIEPAAIAARVDELREQRRLVPLDPADRLSETSTASIGRTFQWAARVLGVVCPYLYVRDDVAGIETIPAREPSIGLGSSVVSGQSAKDLAFLAGRHLTYHRPGHQVVLHYPTRDELTTLLLAAAQVAMPKAAASTDDGAVRALRNRLARNIAPDERAALDKAVRALDARGGNAALGAWMSSLELTASRAGLLLAGDLGTAVTVVRNEARDVASIPQDVRLADLVAFCVSPAHAQMRARFTMIVPESVHPSPLPPAPPPSSSSLQIGP
ncbi:MAG TPA: tetratricopeptide repeat protein [Polyangiaceae bacterium]|jgi:tetratricopeptide (TPR) repeat protein|nr:tetratricopeptide repeat protein [Polyangiaceae bacterium]